MTQKVILTKGLPGVGKTTFAKKLMEDNPGRFTRVNKDDLRAMLHGGKWSPANERQVLAYRDHIILDALERGQHLIVDDTNLHPKHETHIRQLVKGKAVVEIEDFTDVPVEECIQRDLKRAASVGEQVIRKMHRDFLAKPAEVNVWIEGKPVAIIVDVDGTLALLGDRSPYDYSKVSEDLPNWPVVELVKAWQKSNPECHLIITSGRDDSCFKDTSEWLNNLGIFFDALLMRATGDKRHDWVVKREIYYNNIKGNYNISFVIDDRKQVIQLWRSLGLPTFQCAEGDF